MILRRILTCAFYGCIYTSYDSRHYITRAHRLNFVLTLLQRGLSRPQAVQQLTKAFSLSRRQAYRYLDQAQQLRRPVPVTPPKIAFTVKLPSRRSSNSAAMRLVHEFR